MAALSGGQTNLLTQLLSTCSLNYYRISNYNTQSSCLKNNKNNIQQLNGGNIPPWFVSGFTDAEGCFAIIVRKSAKYRLGWRVETVFRIGLHRKDLSLLKLIQTYFGGIGSIVKQGEDVYAYRVSSLKEILTHILPHFDKYPLISNKRGDYLLWKEVVLMMKTGQHLLTEGL